MEAEVIVKASKEMEDGSLRNSKVELASDADKNWTARDEGVKKKRQTMLMGLKVWGWLATCQRVMLKSAEVLGLQALIFYQLHQVVALQQMKLGSLLVVFCFWFHSRSELWSKCRWDSFNFSYEPRGHCWSLLGLWCPMFQQAPAALKSDLHKHLLHLNTWTWSMLLVKQSWC